MKKFIHVLSLLIIILFSLAASKGYADFPERPVGFVVLDYGSNIDEAGYKNIYAPVKWAYHFPNYKIIVSDELDRSVETALEQKKVKVTAELMGKLAAEHNLDVLVVAQIYDLDERIVHPLNIYYDTTEAYTRVVCYADMYCYRADSGKLLRKRIRENFLTDETGYERPEDTLKWQLSKLVNTMEGRPIIGGDN